MEKTFRAIFGMIRKRVFGRNSARNSIMTVEMMVCRTRITDSEPVNWLIIGSRSKAIRIPYNTSAILLPTSIVAMYWLGFVVKIVIILDPNAPCFLSSSIRSLLEDTKAISIPEKNAEKSKKINMIIRLSIRSF